MGFLETILDQGGGVVGKLGKKFGLDEADVSKALAQIVPYVRKEIESRIGGGKPAPKGLVAQVSSGAHDAAVDDPDGDDVDRQGSALLGEVVDDRDQAADQIARQTGLDRALVARLLPTATSVTAGAMKKEGAFDHLLDIQAQVAAKVQAAIDAGKAAKNKA